MKRVVLLAIATLFAASMAFAATNGSIGIFADPAGTNCNLPGTPGIAYYYFVHVNAIGATASEWAAPAPSCMTAVRLADLGVFAINLGTTSGGITIGYGTCKTGTFHIMTALYQVVMAPTPCCRWLVVADPNLPSGKIEIPDCAFLMAYGTGGQGIVNMTVNCPCNVPTQETTWGQVKALYTE
jgi:hypothetical protein